jgi:cyclophilin family peptidyl-prolyl cis-trans isomerase/type II secretory pathway pseudopilin PulG
MPIAFAAVPSEKRARQRALRAQKQQVIQRQQKRRKNLRRFLTYGGLVAVIIIVVVLIQTSGGGKRPSASKPTTTTTATTTTSTFPVPTTQPLTKTAVAPVCPPAKGSKTRVVLFTHAPGDCIPKTSVWTATFVTSVGNFVAKMQAARSYAAVNNFVFLARYQYFNGTFFHRVVKNFVIQGGDPAGTGTGGAGTGSGVLKQFGYPGYEFTGNYPPKSCTTKVTSACYQTGDLVEANRNPNAQQQNASTDGSQFFVVLPGGASTLNTEPTYTIFGKVVSGLSVVEKIGSYGAPSSSQTGAPTKRIYLLKVVVAELKA